MSKSYVSVSKFVKGLNPSSATHILVLFSEYFIGGKFNTSSIGISGVRLMKGNKITKQIEFKDLIKLFGLNPWLNCGKQINKHIQNLKGKLTLHGVKIDLKPKTFYDEYGEEKTYYSLKFIEIKDLNINTDLLCKFESEKIRAQEEEEGAEFMI